MLTKLHVQNFRSVEDAEVEFGPLTVFYGPTSSGKSTLLYSLLILRKFILNPSQSVNSLFDLGFLNLGNWDECLFNHETKRAISIEAFFKDSEYQGSYGINLRKSEIDIKFNSESFKMSMTVSMPYAGNESSSQSYKVGDDEFSVSWNGFAFTVTPETPSAELQLIARTLAEKFNAPIAALKQIDIAPHRRGFFKPSYTPTPLTTPSLTTEDEVATLMINDQYLASRISLNTEDIFDRDFRLSVIPGTQSYALNTTEHGARVPGNVVNDGFGVNQVVYMLAKIFRAETETTLIEEPEVHLHPTVIRKFARALAHIAKDEHKQLAFASHSEQFLLSLLGCVKEETLQPDELFCFYVSREKKKTIFTREIVSRDGQIEGGLSSFMEGELEDIRAFLSPNE